MRTVCRARTLAGPLPLVLGTALLLPLGLSACSVTDAAPVRRTAPATPTDVSGRQEDTFILECDPEAPAHSPEFFDLACDTPAGEGWLALEGLTWYRWGEAQAQATGKAVSSDCQPNCQTSKIDEWPVRVVVGTLKKVKDKYLYSSIKVISEGTPPEGIPRVFTQEVITQ